MSPWDAHGMPMGMVTVPGPHTFHVRHRWPRPARWSVNPAHSAPGDRAEALPLRMSIPVRSEQVFGRMGCEVKGGVGFSRCRTSGKEDDWSILVRG